MDEHGVEQATEEELEKLNVNLSDMGSDSDTDMEDEFTAANEKLVEDLPDSVLVYFKASSNRVNTFEQLILEDLDDLETMCDEMFSPSQHDDLLNELASNFDEDPLKLKERIMSEIEEQLGPPCETNDSDEDYDSEYNTHKDSERQLMLEWRKLEERLRKEEEQRLAELEAEREQDLRSAREEEEKRRRRSEQFKEELRKTEAINQFEYLKPVEGDDEINQSLQLEMVKHQELIKRLEEHIAEERQAFEQVQQEEERRIEARRTAAATKLQAAFRGTLVRDWSKKELTKRREEERRRQQERKEKERRREREEIMKMEQEKERRRMEQEEQYHREEAERRRAEYERAKEQEHRRLERERKLDEQRRKEKEEAKRIEDERNRQEEEKQRRMEERRVEEEMRKVQKEEKEIKEEENAKRIEDEVKIKASLEGIQERKVEVVRRKVQVDEEKKRKEEEKAKRFEDERKRKDEEKQEEMEERSLEEEKKRKEIQEAKRIENERKRKEEEKLKSMGIGRVEEKKSKVQAGEEKERKDMEEAKRTEDERKTKEKEKQKRMEERRVEEEKQRKEVEEAKRTEDERKRKDEEEQKSMEIRREEEEKTKVQTEEEKEKKVEEAKRIEDERKRKEGDEKQKRREEEIRLQQKEQLKESDTEQMQKEQRKKLQEKDIKGGETLMRNADGQNTEERSRNMIKDSVNGFHQKGNPETDKESKNTTKWGKDSVSQLCVSQSVNMSKRFLARTLSSRNGQNKQLSCHLVSAPPTLPTENSTVTVSPPEEDSVTDTRGPQCALEDSSSACLPDSTEQKRLAWMMSCTPWSKLSMQNKRKGLSAPARRRAHRRASGHSLLPLPVDTVLRSGPWSSLKQVTSVALEDLSGCSLCILSECPRLQSLMLRRCGLQALDGLNQCTELQHIDLQENNITHVDCGGLARLEVLLLGRNQLTSIHGLDAAVNLTVLQLSHNIISRISGLGCLKKLHSLTVDHNQLISTRGLSEALTLLHLDCSYNHLSHVEGLENCALLNTLDLRGNNLTELPVLKNHVLLRELYLDDNSICSLHGLDSCWLPLLRWLSAPQNSITQLPLLVDLLSLKTINVSHNCLSELRNICMSLQGCTHLQELSITDNPVQQENNWRSSVLAVNPSLIKLNGEQTGASGKLSADSTQLWSFQALCQAHQDQIDSVLQRHSMEISSAPSALHAQLLVGKHATELFQLAEEQRYAHEYGDSGVCETAMQEPVASSCLQELTDRDLAQERSTEAKTQHPAEHTSLNWQAPCVPNFSHICQSPCGDHAAGCAGSCISLTQKFRDTQPSEERYSRYGVQAARMDLKIVAVMVIQRRWRQYKQRRCPGHLKPHARMSPQTEVKSCKSRPESLNKDYAATVIQAVWRGYALRKRLSRALMLAQISDGDEAFEEVDMDEFTFDEESMEKDWITLQSDMSPSSVLPYSEQLLLPKPLLPQSELHKSASVQLWKARQAWISIEEAPVSEQSQSPDPSTRTQSPASTLGKCSLSERSETILEEWGLSSGSTALLMLKRAQRMKARKQQHQRKLLDPAARLALFRKHNMRPVAMESQKSRPEFREENKAGRGDLSAQEAPRGEPEQTQTLTRYRTYQWLQTQAVPCRRSSAPSASDHFLPEIDPEILNGGRVQLVASTGYREAPDSATKRWIDGAGFSSPQHHQAHTRTHSAGHAKKEVPSPQRVTLAPSRKERISFRDNPVQLSGGWGGGKKRSNANKFK